MTATPSDDEIKPNVHTIARSAESTAAGFQELISAYQTIATERAKTMNETFQALAAAKSPTEFFQLQQSAISEGINAAIRDSGKIARLTAEAMNSAFIPLQKRAEQMVRTTR